MPHLELSFDMRRPAWVTGPASEYAAMVDQCEWADRVGFDVLSFGEHHGTDDGYLPAPLIAAAAVAARTERVWLRTFLPVPFYDPLRLAEDIAVVDRIAEGRLIPVLVAGYRAEEFAMFDKELGRRRALTNEALRIMPQAWTGEPFDFRGREVRVTPTPYRTPPLFAGAMTESVARRTAPLADVVRGEPSVVEAFRDERRKLGLADPGPRPRYSPVVVGISDDTDAAWEEIGPHVIHHVSRYREWITAGSIDVMDERFPPIETVELVKHNPEFVVLRPTECAELGRDLGRDGVLVLQPLCGGIAPELAWRTLHTLEHEVLPHLEIERSEQLRY